MAAPIFLDGRLWGAVIVSSVDDEPFPDGAEQRIADFAELAAQALANANAHEELAASRARIVQAGDAERRRLERNLHDGAQQRLVSLALMLRLAARRHPTTPTSPAPARSSRTRCRSCASWPAASTPRCSPSEGSSRPCARSPTARRCPSTRLSIHERLPDPVEAAAYYVVAEALTNVAKYAHASEVSVELARDNGHALHRGPRRRHRRRHAGRGTGLRGLADRVEALGGRLVLDSPAGAGTTLRAEIPCS